MSENARSRPSVLLLEDDNQWADMVIASLGDDFDFERAANADEAKLLLAARPFEILLADHMMPGGQQGLDFLVESRERYPKLHRILVTGYINPDLLSRSMAVAGLSACLMKPVDMKEMRRTLRVLLGMDV